MEATAFTVDLLPQDNIPNRISITFTIESIRNKHPITDPTADPSIPNRNAFRLMCALNASSTSLLLSRLMASLRPWATRDEKRKKLNDTTSNTKSFFATEISASQADRFSRLRWPGVVRERPTKTAIVKRELTFTRPSSAVTWILVVDVDDSVDDDGIRDLLCCSQ